ncbi:hypothetical protein [Candidatus Binatus sp.]|jgi:hypothetical protein|uniref:hypothetical protein n=1 Tax=Candidatus Binatus sp. TaxID=2811406 RepID=UPI003BEDAF49
MCRRRRGTFRVAGIGIFASLLLAGCSSGTNAPLKASNERRGEYPAPKASPDFEHLSQRKSANISAGGLEAPETGSSLGGNLLVNGDFARGLEGWHASARCFRPDSATRAPNGKPSLKIENPDSCGPFAKVAVNKFVAPPGVYSIGGEIKTPDLAEPRRLVVGAGMDLFTACETEVVNGTADWQQLVGKHCIVAPGTHAPFQLAINGETSGSAWFANMYVRREIAPLVRIFMLYPNYRGYLFADQPQQVRAAVTLNPGPDLRRQDLVFRLEAMRTDSGAKTDHTYKSPADDFTATLDFGPLPAGVYQVRATLLGSDGKVLFEQPPYRVVKLDSKPGVLLKAWIDPDNLAHFIDGNPHFVLGIYDTTGWSYAPASFVKGLAAIRKAPINMIINYFLSNAPTPAVTAYTTAMKQFGITFLPDVSGFHTGSSAFPTGIANEFGTDDPDQLITDYVSTFTSDRAVVGYYVQDEPAITAQPETFHQYSVIKAADPSGFNLAVLDRPLDVPFWKDAVDVVGVDPYPVWLPVGNYIAEVGDWTRMAVQAVHASRPVWTVIQFFQADSVSSWPTEQQLHDMSWMAIAEGANGVFYWSHGIRALGWVRNPAEKAALWGLLVRVTNEIKDLEPVLLRPDTQVLTAQPSQDIVTREKTGEDGVRYVIAYNHGSDAAPARFVLRSPAQSVTIRRGMVKVEIKDGYTFEDKFDGYEAKVYEIR